MMLGIDLLNPDKEEFFYKVRLLNKHPDKRQTKYKHYEELRFDKIRPMTPNESLIKRLTLKSHPGKAIVI